MERLDDFKKAKSLTKDIMTLCTENKPLVVVYALEAVLASYRELYPDIYQSAVEALNSEDDEI